MEGGAWDRASAANGNRPVALDLAGTPFGKAAYVGNSMLDVQPGQTMADAYDALIFLRPLEALRSSAKTGFYFTPAFRTEVERRIRILEGDGLAEMLAREGCSTIGQFVDRLAAGAPEAPSKLLP
jgi:hypothetical protein